MKRVIKKLVMCIIFVMMASVNVQAEGFSVGGGTVTISTTQNEDGTTTATVTGSRGNIAGKVDLSFLEEKADRVVIGTQSFFSKSQITEVVLPGNTVSIDSMAFYFCFNLEKINIPEHCESIGENALFNAALTELVLPEGLETLGQGCLVNNMKLVKCVFYNEELDLSNAGIDTCTAAALTFWCDTGSRENCPSDYAKKNAIKRVLLNGEEVLEDNQEKLNIGENGTILVEYGEIREGVADTLTLVRGEGVQGEVDLTFLASKGREILVGQKAFYCNENITSVILPENTVRIGKAAFRSCKNLASCNLTNDIEMIEDYAFYETAIPSAQIPAGCTELGEFVYQCSMLQHVTFDEGEQELKIGAYAFYSCKQLSGVKLPQRMKSMGDAVFGFCESLSVIRIPASCTEIGASVFASSKNLDTVIFENGETTIASTAFNGITRNVDIYSLKSDKDNTPYPFCESKNNFQWHNLINAIRIKTPIEKSEYAYGEEFDQASISICGEYKTEDGYEWRDIPASQWTMSGYDRYTLGTQGLVFKSHDVTTSLDVSVYEDIDHVTGRVDSPSYTGASQMVKPIITWKDHDGVVQTLREGVDYKITSYDNNVNAGEAAINIEGMGNYKKSTRVPFVIEPADITGGEVTGVKGAPVVTLVDLTGETEEKVTLTAGVDYEVSYDEEDRITENGKEKVRTVIKGKNNYKGETAAYLDMEIEAGTEVELPVGNGSITVKKIWNADKTQATITVESSRDISGDADLSFLDNLGNRTIIGERAFRENGKLVSVILPDNTILIGSTAFELCSKLNTINIPDSCESIESFAFYGTALTEVVFPKSVQSLGNKCFYAITNLKKCVFYNSELDVSSSGLDYTSINRKEPLVFWCNDGLTANCPSAYAKNNSIKRVLLDGSEILAENQKKFDLHIGTITVEYGEKAENGESTLTVVASEGVWGDADLAFLESEATQVVIGPGVFQNNKNITSVKLPENTVEIGDYAFSKCSKLRECAIPGGVTSIGISAFDGVNISSVTIPAACVELGDGAFSNAYVEKVVFEEGNQELKLGYDVFAFCNKLSDVQLPERLVSMGSRAFGYCYALTNIRIPDNCSAIGGSAFLDDKNLASVKLPAALQAIESSLFSGCTGLLAVTIPEGCESIGEQSFAGCSLLTAITIPQACKKVQKQAFWKCTGLRTIIFENGDTILDPTAFFETNDEYVIYSAKSQQANSPYQFYLDNKSDVRWDNILQDLQVVKPVNRTEYFYGEAFDYSSISIVGVYKTEKGNETRAIPSGEWTMVGYNNHLLGLQTLHFLSQDIQDSSNVRVRVYYDMEQVEAEGNPSSTDKEENGKLNVYWVDDEQNVHMLTEGEDYELSYEEDDMEGGNAGKVKVVITGINNYVGEKTVYMDKPEAGEEPVPNEPVPDEPVTEEPVPEEPIPDEPATEEPAPNEPATEEPVPNEPIPNTPTTTEPGGASTEETTTKKSKQTKLKKGDTFEVSKGCYRVTGKNTVTFVGCRDNEIEKLVIPKTVKKNGKTYKITKIGKKACYKYAKLTNVYIGDNVTVVGEYAFAACPKLLNVTIGSDVEVLEKKVFYKAKRMKKIKFKTEKLERIEKDVFKGVNKKVKIVVPKTKVSKYSRLING